MIDRARPFALIRTDAVPATGTGHAMRCLALAQALGAHGLECRFLVTELPPLIAQRFQREGYAIERLNHRIAGSEDAEATLRRSRELGASWIVLDGYAFDTAYVSHISSGSARVLVVDDLGQLDRYPCALVLNQNLHAHPRMYRGVEAETKLLLGTRYLMLRREFWSYDRGARTIASHTHRILISMGGSDPEDHASRAIDALALLRERDIGATLVVGAANPRLDVLRARAASSPCPIEVVHNSSDMPALMQRADLALAAAGTTVWELAFTGVPMVLGSTVEAERLLARRLAEAKGCLYMGEFHDCVPGRIAATLDEISADVEQRLELSRTAQALVDGKGGSRVVAAMLGYGRDTEEAGHAA